jgi:hypothetical protein
VVSPGASVQVDKLDVVTPSGLLQMNAKVSWPIANFVAPDDVSDMLQSSHITASLRISTALTNDIIGLISKLIYLYQIPDEDKIGLVELKHNVLFLSNINRSVIGDLVDEQAISKEDADELDMLVQYNASYDDYFETVKRLLFNRKIALSAAYFLDWQYSMYSEQSDSLDKELSHFEDATTQQIRFDLNNFINKGYIEEEKDDYVVNLVRDNGILKLNGHTVNKN